MITKDPRQVALARVWQAMVNGAREYVSDEGFTCIHGLPHLTTISGSCEAVSSLYSVDHFGTTAYLAQSDQLHLEMFTPAFEKVWCEIHSFRAESEVDNRHLCEFPLFEIEHLGYFEELQKHVTGVVARAVEHVVDRCEEELQTLGVSLKHWNLLNHISFDDLSYADAITFLQKNGFPKTTWGDDLKAEHELAITDEYGPVVLKRFPLQIKFFSMSEDYPDADPNGPVARSCDLLLPYAGESAGAAERETDFEKLSTRLRSSDMYRILLEQGVKDEDFDWYLNVHRDNDVPTHSGAGIGLARVAQFIIEEKDIRKAVLFPTNRETLV